MYEYSYSIGKAQMVKHYLPQNKEATVYTLYSTVCHSKHFCSQQLKLNEWTKLKGNCFKAFFISFKSRDKF